MDDMDLFTGTLANCDAAILSQTARKESDNVRAPQKVPERWRYDNLAPSEPPIRWREAKEE
jgi:hypothetical protein